MSMELKLTGVKGFVEDREIDLMNDMIQTANDMLLNHTGAGSDFHGWIDLPVAYDKDEFARIKKAAAKIQSNSDLLVVIGIGGSYMGKCITASGKRASQKFILLAPTFPRLISMM